MQPLAACIINPALTHEFQPPPGQKHAQAVKLERYNNKQLALRRQGKKSFVVETPSVTRWRPTRTRRGGPGTCTRRPPGAELGRATAAAARARRRGPAARSGPRRIRVTRVASLRAAAAINSRLQPPQRPHQSSPASILSGHCLVRVLGSLRRSITIRT